MPFEIRKDDRNIVAGDTVTLREYMPGQDYTGRFRDFSVTCVLRDFPGIAEGYCAIGISPITVRHGTDS